METHPPTDALLPDISEADTTVREVGDVTLHVVAAGDPGDPLVVLLHGFPEFWYEWREYIEPIVAAGYRVVVPDQRGYNRSDKPPGVRAYRMTELSGDVVDLVAAEGYDSAHVVGHDWGGAVAWDVALRHPETVERLAVINAAHPTVFEDVLLSNPTQLRKSWYLFFFQLPRLPEWYLRRNEYDGLVTAMRGGSRPGTFLWGENDQALVSDMAPKSLACCSEGDLERFPDATHWLPHEHPRRVADLLLDHFGS